MPTNSKEISKKLQKFLDLPQVERIKNVKSGKFEVHSEEVDHFARKITPKEFAELLVAQWGKQDKKTFRTALRFTTECHDEVVVKDFFKTFPRSKIRVSELVAMNQPKSR